MSSPRLAAALSRRLLLREGATLAAATFVQFRAQAQDDPAFANPGATIIVLSDLHSPYATLAQLLAAVTASLAGTAPENRLILVNGDCFERGNVVALRSGGSADWAFLAALATLGEVVLNIGNHETALVDDLAFTITRMRDIGITVLSNLTDTRSGKPYAPGVLRRRLAGKSIAIAALGTDLMPTYRPVVRPLIQVPEPVAYAADTVPGLLAGAEMRIILSHAGLAADKQFWTGPAKAQLTVGGHDHLTLATGVAGQRQLIHTGAWGTRFTVLQWVQAAGGATLWRSFAQEIDRTMPAAPALADLIGNDLAAHLAIEDRAIIATLPKALPLPQAAAFASEAIRRAANADVGLISHTTLGTGLPQGAVTKYDFDALIRFDGEISMVEMTGAALAPILARSNQATRPLDEMTGDFVHAQELAIDPAATYKVAALGWVAMNQQAYLGVSGLHFQPVPGLKLKALVAAALAGK